MRKYVVTYVSIYEEGDETDPMRVTIGADDSEDAAHRFRSLFNECFGDTMRCRVLGVRPGMTEAHAAAVA